MKITQTKKFKSELREIALFIKKDKINASVEFVQKLKEKINKLENFPLKHRKSIYFNDDNTRDMIYQGYTIVYEVDLENESILILSVFNRNLPVIGV